MEELSFSDFELLPNRRRFAQNPVNEGAHVLSTTAVLIGP